MALKKTKHLNTLVQTDIPPCHVHVMHLTKDTRLPPCKRTKTEKESTPQGRNEAIISSDDVGEVIHTPKGQDIPIIVSPDDEITKANHKSPDSSPSASLSSKSMLQGWDNGIKESQYEIISSSSECPSQGLETENEKINTETKKTTTPMTVTTCLKTQACR